VQELTGSHYCTLQMLESAVGLEHVTISRGGLPQARWAALESGAIRVATLMEPFISLGSAGFRVVTVELLEDPAIFTPNGLLAIRVVLGADVADPALPVATLLLRATRTAGSLVVPGVPAGAPVAAAIDLIRHGEQPARTTTRLAPAETTLYVQL